MKEKLFPCTIVGSYSQPEWLIDKEKLLRRFPPRTRAKELWRIPAEQLESAQNDATLLAIRDQELAGLDVITDGEVRRESYSNHFATALEGVDTDSPGDALDRSGEPVKVPRVTGVIERNEPIAVKDVAFLKANTNKQIKITLPGPFTMSQQAQIEYYDSPRDCALAYAGAVNAEIKDLFATGVDVVQIDEPYMQARPDAARDYGIEALNAALEDIDGKTCVHICFGYAALIHERPEGYSFLPEFTEINCDQVSIETAQSKLDCKILETLPDKEIMLGVIDLSTHEIETVETVVERVRRALPHIAPERIVLAPDCGMKYIPRDVAFGKLKTMCMAGEILRAE